MTTIDEQPNGQLVTQTKRVAPPRLISLDAYRGFVMLLMVSSSLGIPAIARAKPNSETWKALAYQFEHVEWTGCSLWDLIQPSFMFIVGVAMPFSDLRRRAAGQSFPRSLLHALIRSAVLVVLGVMLYSNYHKQTNYTFVNVLAQIGLAYPFVYLAMRGGPAIQGVALLAVLAGSWLMFETHPILNEDEVIAMNLPGDWRQFTGDAAHWNKHANAAGAFDRWFLNLFPRKEPFIANGGGYQTLNFIPSMATMLLGVLAGQCLLTSWSSARKRNLLILASLVCFASSMLVDHTIWPVRIPPIEEKPSFIQAGFSGMAFESHHWTICPAVKRIWTPTFAVFSAGWTFLLLAFFYWVIDEKGYRRWAFPFVVVGMNSIVIYILHETLDGWIKQTLKTHFGQDVFVRPFFLPTGTSYQPMVANLLALFSLWLFCYWLYRQRIFVRI